MWRNLHFRKLWLANSVSSMGTQVTVIALPLTAVALLHASGAQMGILAACGTLPYLAMELPAGVWVDRLQRRPILIIADVSRALLLGIIPPLAISGMLQMEHLYLIAFLTGILSLFYDVTEEAYLPAIVERDHLIQANGQLAAIDATAELIAPVVAGGLVQWLTAPIAIAIDAPSFLWSASWLGCIRRKEAIPVRSKNSNVWQEIREGMAYLLHNPLLRPSIMTGIQWQLFGGMKDALLILFLAETLQLPPTAIGLVYAVGSLSGLITTPFSRKATRRFGPGPTMIGSALLIGSGWLIVSLSFGTPVRSFAMIVAGMLIAGAGNMSWNITAASVTQAITPNRLLGRVNATDRFLTWGALPLGSLLGGWLAELWGLRQALILSGSGVFLGALWVWLSPLHTLHRFPVDAPNNEPALQID